MSEVKSSKTQLTLLDVLKRCGCADCRQEHEGAVAEIERLQAVGVAAKRLVQTAHDYIDHDETTVEEPALTALESALAAAGYDMTDGEFCGRLTPAPESRDG